MTDKKDVIFDPLSYFDSKAISRRKKINIPISDSTDFPLNQSYILKIKVGVEEIISTSRWFNAIIVQAYPEQLRSILEFDFVSDIQSAEVNTIRSSYRENVVPDIYDSILKEQIEIMRGDLFIEKGIDGKGIRIAVFDGGFPMVDKSPVFEHLRENNQIIKTYDFIRNREYVYNYLQHGTEVLSCIAGIINGQRMGLGTGAEFLLARTEIRPERFSEEEYWLAAAEWADKNGADIINSSLGYTSYRYNPGEMNGEISLVAKAAKMAVSKGILVINSIGNEGDNKWEIMGTPADVDSVLSIGSIDINTGYHAAYSSFGPGSEKKMKPNLTALGNVVVYGRHRFNIKKGTSYSCALVAGFAACAMQINPDLGNMKMFRQLERSGKLFPYYDYAHGYGIPQASCFVESENKEKPPTFFFKLINDVLHVIVFEDFKYNDFIGDQNLLYYHIEDEDKTLEKYSVIEVYQNDVLQIPLSQFNSNKIIRVFYKNYTESYYL